MISSGLSACRLPEPGRAVGGCIEEIYVAFTAVWLTNGFVPDGTLWNSILNCTTHILSLTGQPENTVILKNQQNESKQNHLFDSIIARLK
jgi:hypothetical protein